MSGQRFLPDRGRMSQGRSSVLVKAADCTLHHFIILTPLSVKESALQLQHLDSKTADCEISINGLLKLFKSIPLNKKNSLFSPNWVIGFLYSTSAHMCLFPMFAVSLN